MFPYTHLPLQFVLPQKQPFTQTVPENAFLQQMTPEYSNELEWEEGHTGTDSHLDFMPPDLYEYLEEELQKLHKPKFMSDDSFFLIGSNNAFQGAADLPLLLSDLCPDRNENQEEQPPNHTIVRKATLRPVFKIERVQKIPMNSRCINKSTSSQIKGRRKKAITHLSKRSKNSVRNHSLGSTADQQSVKSFPEEKAEYKDFAVTMVEVPIINDPLFELRRKGQKKI